MVASLVKAATRLNIWRLSPSSVSAVDHSSTSLPTMAGNTYSELYCDTASDARACVATRVYAVDRSVGHVGVSIRCPRLPPPADGRVAADKPPRARVIVARLQVVEPGLPSPLLPRVLKRLIDCPLRLGGHPERIRLVGLHDRARAIRQRPHRPEAIPVGLADRARAVHRVGQPGPRVVCLAPLSRLGSLDGLALIGTDRS